MIDENKLIGDLHILRDVMDFDGKQGFQKGFVSGIDKAIELAGQSDKIENDVTFENFWLYSDSTLLGMRKQDLVDYIHILYHNWQVENGCSVRLRQIINEMERSK